MNMLFQTFYKGRQSYNDFQQGLNNKKDNISPEMFKVRPAKKSTTALGVKNRQNNNSEKRMELNQNNDIINIQSQQNIQYCPQNKQPLGNTQNNHTNKVFIRPRSGLNKRYIGRTSSLKYEVNDQKLISQKIKQKAQQRLKPQRPSTSINMNQNDNLKFDKKPPKLINRRGTLTNTSTNLPKSTHLIPNQQINISQNQSNLPEGYMSNQQALTIILNILQQQQEYKKLRNTNKDQFQKIKQKLISNVSLIVLKWSKIIQDKLYNQVKSITTVNQQDPMKLSHSTIEQLIKEEIKRHFLKQNGSFLVQQRWNMQQSRLQNLIDTRLEKLQDLLTTACAMKS